MARGLPTRGFPSRVALRHLAAFVCCVLVLWATVDQFYCTQSTDDPAGPSVPHDDDDDMAQPPAAVRPDCPRASAPSYEARPAPARPRALSSQTASGPIRPARERDAVNGVGAPLLC
jgi:hypothetical protein